MIIIKLQGGLGNQMFQYALGRNLSLTHGVPLKIDYSYLKTPNQSDRKYQLDGFKIQATEASPEELRAYIGITQKILDHFWRKDSDKKHFRETSELLNGEILKHSDGYFDGHWQNEKYFKAYEQKILKDFSLKNPFGSEAEKMAEEIYSKKNATSLHIRRGDYISIPKIADAHGALPISYYEAACNKILETAPDAHFFISSDDILWAKENFPKNYPATLVSSPAIPDHEELALMSRCQHNIIANSTFSWWGARLNRNLEKMVIAPKHWFRDSKKENPNLILQSWTKI